MEFGGNGTYITIHFGCLALIGTAAWLWFALAFGWTPWAMENRVLGGLLLVGPVAAFWGLAWWDRRHFKNSQVWRDRRAQRVAAGKASFPYVIYLRSFVEPAALEGARQFESLLARAFEPREAFVALKSIHEEDPIQPGHLHMVDGRRLGYLGAGRVAIASERWQEQIATMLRDAALIIMVPGSGAGLLWEIEQIMANEWWSKTLFVMPRDFVFMEWGDFFEQIGLQRQKEQEDAWKLAVAAYRKLGISLPDYDRHGGLFILGPDRKVLESHPIPDKPNRRSMRRLTGMLRTRLQSRPRG